MPLLPLLLLLNIFSFQLSPAAAGEFPVLVKGPSGLFGYKDEKGRFVIEPQYEQAHPFTNGVARVMRGNEWRLINDRGKILTKVPYQEIQDFRNGVAIVGKKEGTVNRSRLLYGLLNGKGQEVITPKYLYLTPDLNFRIFIVGQEGPTAQDGRGRIEFGVINHEGEIVVPVAFMAVRENQFKVFAVKDEKGMWKAFDAEGNQLFDGVYSDIKDFDEELATVKKDGRWGIIHRNGKEVVKPNYRTIIKRSRHHYEMMGYTQWKVVNHQKETVLSMEYEDVQPVHPTLYSYQIEGKKGLLNEKGSPITEAHFDDIFPFQKDMAIVRQEGKYGAITLKGQVFLPIKYQAVSIDAGTSLLRVQENNQWGVVNRVGKMVVPVQYDAIRIQPYGLFTVRKKGQWHVLNESGGVAGHLQLDSLGDYQNLHAVGLLNGKYGLLTIDGNWALEPAYDSLRIVNEFLALYRGDGRKGLINIHTHNTLLAVDEVAPLRNYFQVISAGKSGVVNYRGDEVIPMKYDFISDFSTDSIVTVIQGAKKGLVSLSGKTILAPDALYQDLFVMTNERVGVRIKNKYGFVDDRGRLRIANRYEGVGTFSEGMAAVKIQGGWGYVDKEENLRVQPHYEEALPFHNGVARVKRFGKWGFVGKDGKETVKPQYDKIELLSTGRYLVYKNTLKGLVSEKGKELFGPKYDFVSDHANGFVLLGRNAKLGLADTGGFDVLPVIYDRLYFNASKNFYVTGIEPLIQKFSYNPN